METIQCLAPSKPHMPPMSVWHELPRIMGPCLWETEIMQINKHNTTQTVAFISHQNKASPSQIPQPHFFSSISSSQTQILTFHPHPLFLKPPGKARPLPLPLQCHHPRPPFKSHHQNSLPFPTLWIAWTHACQWHPSWPLHRPLCSQSVRAVACAERGAAGSRLRYQDRACFVQCVRQ